MTPNELDLSEFEAKSSKWDSFVEKNQTVVIMFLVGLILIGFGVLIFKRSIFEPSTKIEVLESTTESQNTQIIVEIAGAIQKPGVYKMTGDGRIDDLLIIAGGLSQDADRIWVEKNINRAAKLTDGQKVVIRSVDEQTTVTSAKNSGVYQSDTLSYSTSTEEMTNINEASLEKLDKLPGIGPVYGQKIIDQRPYSNIEELRNKNIIPKSTYEKIKDLISVY